MADGKDASTDIEKVVGSFCKDMSAAATKLLKDAAGKPTAKPATKPGAKDGKPAEIVFALSKAPYTGFRTPADQALEVAQGKSWVCWGAHMADKARDIIMKVDGKASFEPKKVFGDSFGDFKAAWGAAMKKNGLKNYKAGDGWADGDEFHLELPDARMPKSDERARACIKAYVDLTHGDKAKYKPNARFEKEYASLLKPYIDAESKAGAKAGAK